MTHLVDSKFKCSEVTQTHHWKNTVGIAHKETPAKCTHHLPYVCMPYRHNCVGVHNPRAWVVCVRSLWQGHLQMFHSYNAVIHSVR